MASSSADCVFGGVRLISSASRTLREDRARARTSTAVAGGGILLDDVGAGDVGGHQVGRELDALELQAQRLRHRAHQRRFRRARQAGDQAMAADKQRDEHLLDHLFLADDHAPDLPRDRRLRFLESLKAAAKLDSVDGSCGCY